MAKIQSLMELLDNPEMAARMEAGEDMVSLALELETLEDEK